MPKDKNKQVIAVCLIFLKLQMQNAAVSDYVNKAATQPRSLCQENCFESNVNSTFSRGGIINQEDLSISKSRQHKRVRQASID